MFQKKYPHLGTEAFSVGLDDLLNWPHWANFIKIYCTLINFCHLETALCFLLYMYLFQVDLQKREMVCLINVRKHASLQSPYLRKWHDNLERETLPLKSWKNFRAILNK